MADNKKALIFQYADMNIGGVQKYIANLVGELSEKNIDAYWISSGSSYIDPGFQEKIENVKNIQMGEAKGKIETISKEYAQVSIITLSFLAFEKLRYICKLALQRDNVNIFLLIPHFENPELFPEKYFNKSKKRDRVFEYAKKRYQQFIDENSVFFFSTKHVDTMAEHYGISISDKDKRVVKSVIKTRDFDDAVANVRAKRNTFNIISVARFELPHKGYFLGLIRIFPEVRKIRQDATLTIIGYGDGEKQIREAINCLDDDSRRAIHLVGKVSYNDLYKYYKKANLSFALAGSVTDSASFGVPTLVVRHYCEDCETYGLLPDSYSLRLSELPGEDPLPHIQDVVGMNDKEYITLCQKTYSVLETNRKNFDPEWVFKVDESSLTDGDEKMIKIISYAESRFIRHYRLSLLLHNPKIFVKKTILRLKLALKR